MLILGLTEGIDHMFEPFGMAAGLGHDASAVLAEDGKVIAGIEEERLNRIKHSNKIRASSVRFCLESANRSLADIDAIAFYASEDFLNDMLKKRRLTTPMPDGDDTIHTDQTAGLHGLLTPSRRGEPFMRIHMDMAAALQEAWDDIVFHMLRHFRQATISQAI